MTPIQIITAICPPLAIDANVNIFIEMAIEQTDGGYFGTNYSKAVALRASHEYTLSRRISGETGSITSKTEGKLSMSFGASSSMSTGNAFNDALGQTHYGKQLLGLIASQYPAIGVIVSDDNIVDGSV